MSYDYQQSRWRRPYYRPRSREPIFNNDYADIDGQDAQPFIPAPESELDNGFAPNQQYSVVLDGGIANQP